MDRTDKYGRVTGYVDPNALDNGSHLDGFSEVQYQRPPDQDNVALSRIATCDEFPKALGVFHRPVLDIDFEARLVESSTPGHYHLYLDGVAVDHEDYMDLLKVLSRCGIIGPGYMAYSLDRGYTVVRTKGRKPVDVDAYQLRHLAPVPDLPDEDLLVYDPMAEPF